MDKNLIEMAARICVNFGGMGVGFATGNKEEVAYFRKVLQQKTEEKKALEELKRKREMKKKIRERYRKLLNRMEKDDMLDLSGDELKEIIMYETNKWLEK